VIKLVLIGWQATEKPEIWAA